MWVLFAFGVGTRAGSPLEERVPRRRPVAATGARRRRACVERSRLPCLCGGSFLGLFSRERGSDAVVSAHFSFSLRLCKKRRVCIRLNRHGNYDYVLRDRPRLRPRPGGGHSSPLQVVSVKAALSVVFQGSSTVPRSARALPRPVPWYHWIGGRESWLRKWPPEIRSCSGCSERSLSKLCYHVGACHPTSPATETKQPWRHWVQLA